MTPIRVKRLPIACLIFALATWITGNRMFAEDLTEAARDGFVNLFNGENLNGWVAEGTKSYPDGDVKKPVWTVQDGVIHCAGKGYGFLRYDEPFTDFELRLEYRLAPKCNSGVGIRHGKFTGTVNSRPSLAGYEIQILDDGGKETTTHSTGSLYRYVAAKSSPGKPAGQWNEMSIECRGPKIKIVLNGEVIQDVDQSTEPAIAEKPLRGYVSLQNHGGEVSFRAIRVKKLE